jgi:delta-sarcoglycan
MITDSSRNFTINTRNIDGFIDNQMFLGHDKVEFYTNTLKVTDTHGTTLFAADRDRVTVGASSLKINGDGGAIFKESVQTPLVRSDAGQDLM